MNESLFIKEDEVPESMFVHASLTEAEGAGDELEELINLFNKPNSITSESDEDVSEEEDTPTPILSSAVASHLNSGCRLYGTGKLASRRIQGGGRDNPVMRATLADGFYERNISGDLSEVEVCLELMRVFRLRHRPTTLPLT